MNSLFTYFFAMLFTDFAAGHLLYGLTVSPLFEELSLLKLSLMYTVPAFALRIAAGILADIADKKQPRVKAMRIIGTAGPVFVCAALITGLYTPYAAAVLAGIGIALTGTAAGINAMAVTSGYTRAGILMCVSPLGFAAGMHFAETGVIPMQYAFVLLAFITLCAFNFGYEKRTAGCMAYAEESNVSSGFKKLIFGQKPVISMTAASLPVILTAIAALSLAGFAAFNPGSESRFAWLIPSAAFFAGVFVGGIAADTIGARVTGTVALLLSAPLFYLGTQKFIIYAAAIFLSSTALPILVCSLAGRLEEYEGSSYGLSSMMLFLGAGLAQIVTGRLIPSDTEEIAADGASSAAGEIAEEALSVPGYAKTLIPLLLVFAAAAVFITAYGRRIKSERV
ncbi:MAG: hypothetical protein MJ137_04000 [Clostridia bacterium]|nr:hypothetical protein [Clostridia bacterium]